MYHLMIASNSQRSSEFGLCFGKPKHYYLSSANDVCEVLCSLNHLSDLCYTIEKIDLFSVSEILKDFELKEV